MAASQPSIEEQLSQLESARRLVLQDPAYWPQVFHGTLPIIAGPIIEVRRWGADFLAQTFSTPIVDAKVKQELALPCLDTLLRLAGESEAGILKSVVQCSASVYPIIFRHICTNRDDTDVWNKAAAIKSKVLGLWDTAPTGVRVACTKFAQRVVLVQSRGTTDPRLIDRSDTSLALVPTNHPLLSLPALDAESQGLLDRLLSILHDDPSDPSLATATLNNLSAIIKTRPPMASKIINAVLSFNPLAGAARGLTIGNRLLMVSMEKTARVLLLNVVRSNPQSPFVQRITAHLQRMTQAKAEISEEASRKRAAPSSDFDTTKRVKLERGQAQSTAKSTPEPATPQIAHPAQQIITGPLTYAQLYTLATDPAMTSFDGQQLPIELVLQIVLGSIMSADQRRLEAAIAAVRDRYTALMANPAPPSAIPSQAGTPLASSTPSGTAGEPPDGLLTSGEAADSNSVHLALGEFRLPPPPPLSSAALRSTAINAIDRMFAIIDGFDKTSLIARKSKLGVNRLAASNWDREGWVTLIARFATRAAATREAADAVRERLYAYVTTDFRARMDVATAWLNEEWYNDRLMAREEQEQVKQRRGSTASNGSLPNSGAMDESADTKAAPEEFDEDEDSYDPEAPPTTSEDREPVVVRTDLDRSKSSNNDSPPATAEPQYTKWAMRLMDAIFPFVEAKDRTFLRMLSEIPAVPPELLDKVKLLCLDPDRTALGMQMLHYLAMLRPPVREGCLDVLEDLWRNHPELQKQAQKLLQKWRPQVLVQRIELGKQEPAPTPTPEPPAAAAPPAALPVEPPVAPPADPRIAPPADPRVAIPDPRVAPPTDPRIAAALPLHDAMTDAPPADAPPADEPMLPLPEATVTMTDAYIKSEDNNGNVNVKSENENGNDGDNYNNDNDNDNDNDNMPDAVATTPPPPNTFPPPSPTSSSELSEPPRSDSLTPVPVINSSPTAPIGA